MLAGMFWTALGKHGSKWPKVTNGQNPVVFDVNVSDRHWGCSYDDMIMN